MLIPSSESLPNFSLTQALIPRYVPYAVIGDGSPDEVRNNPDVIDAYLGATH